MKIRSIIKLITFLGAGGFVACTQNSEKGVYVQAVSQTSNFMTFDSVEVVTNFPNVITVEKGKHLDKEFIGMKDFEIVDNLMIISTGFQKFWSIYQLPNFDSLGNFLSLGEGPKEFTFQAIPSDKVLYQQENNDKTALIYEFSKGNLLKFNITQSVKMGKDSIELIEDDLPPFLFDFLVIDSSYYFIRQPENQETKQNRYLLSSGHLTSNAALDQLNRAEISNGMMNMSLMASMTRISPDSKKILEMYFRLNYFNLYALDGTLKKTIAFEPTINDLSLLENTPRMEQKYRFSDVRIYDDFFALLHLNELEENFASERKSYPEILIFDWDGNPVTKLLFNDFFTSFDFDFANEKIYTFDSQTDQFRFHEVNRFWN